MQYIDCFINPISRQVSYPGAVIVQRDTHVEALRFHFSLQAEHALEDDSIRVMVKTGKEIRGFNAENVRVETNDGGDEELVFEHTITRYETEVPGQINVSVCGNQISGDTITEAWHTLNMSFQVGSSVHTDSDEGEDSEETAASNAEKIAALQTLVDAITSGRPIPVDLKSKMVDTSAIYLYTGNETGEQHNYWYYHDGTSWVPGSEYGGMTIDDELSSTSENAVQNKVIKANFDEVNGRLQQLATFHDASLNALFGPVNASNTSGAGASTLTPTILVTDNLSVEGVENDIYVYFGEITTDYEGTVTDTKIRLYQYASDNSVISRTYLTSGQSVALSSDCDHIAVAVMPTTESGNTSGYTWTVADLTVSDGEYAPSEDSVELKSNVVVPLAVENAERISALEGGIIPSYYNTYLADKISAIRAKNLLSGRNGDSFIFLTDPHWLTNTQHSTLIAKRISEQTTNKMYICGGDILTQWRTRAEALSILWDYMNRMRKAYGQDYRYIFGNHELNTMATVADADKLTYSDVYAVCMKDIENEVSIYGSSDTESFIYHWDNEAQKIRYIVLNTATNVQFSGNYRPLDELIRSTPNGYKIGVFAHAFFKSDGTLTTSATFITGMLDAVNGRTSYTFYNTTYDYSNLDAEVMFCMGGHTHKDLYIKTEHGVPVIGTTTDNRYLELGGLDRTVGSTTEHAFDAVDIDTVNRTIYLTRIGAGNDRTYTWEVAS